VSIALGDFKMPVHGHLLFFVNNKLIHSVSEHPLAELSFMVQHINDGPYSLVVQVTTADGMPTNLNTTVNFHMFTQPQQPVVFIHSPAHDGFFYGSLALFRGSIYAFEPQLNGNSAYLFIDGAIVSELTSSHWGVEYSVVAGQYNISVGLFDGNKRLVASRSHTLYVGESDMGFGYIMQTAVDMQQLSARRQSFFAKVFRQNVWGSEETVSGHGSTMNATRYIRPYLQDFLSREQIRTFIDMPCGDLHWMKTMNLEGVKYTGADIVPDLVRNNKKKFEQQVSTGQYDFLTWDAVFTPMDRMYDLILMRDLIFHLPKWEVVHLLRHLNASKSKYMMISHNPYNHENHMIEGVPWNLHEPPFSLPPPIETLSEDGPEKTHRLAKYLSLWRLPLPPIPDEPTPFDDDFPKPGDANYHIPGSPNPAKNIMDEMR